MADHPDGRVVVEDDFDGPRLDPALWLPHYLPAWSSRALSAASYELRDSCLHLRSRAALTPRSMAAFWLVGLEDSPTRSAEICVMEVFGDAVRPGSTEVGVGLHPFRDPAVAEDWAAVRQLMLAVFDFPERSVGDDDAAVPELVVDSIREVAAARPGGPPQPPRLDP